MYLWVNLPLHYAGLIVGFEGDEECNKSIGSVVQVQGVNNGKEAAVNKGRQE